MQFTGELNRLLANKSLDELNELNELDELGELGGEVALERALEVLILGREVLYLLWRATPQRRRPIGREGWRESAELRKLLLEAGGWGGAPRRPWVGSEGCKKARRARWTALAWSSG